MGLQNLMCAVMGNKQYTLQTTYTYNSLLFVFFLTCDSSQKLQIKSAIQYVHNLSFLFTQTA